MTHICPIDGRRLNEQTIRVVAAIVAIITVFGIITKSPIIFLFLTIDFCVRGFYKKEWSLLRYVGIQITNFFRFKEKLIDGGGKKFASRIGFLFSFSLFVLSLIHWFIAINWVGSILISCAVLEAVFSYCIGCKVYTLYFNLKSKTE